MNVVFKFNYPAPPSSGDRMKSAPDPLESGAEQPSHNTLSGEIGSPEAVDGTSTLIAHDNSDERPKSRRGGGHVDPNCCSEEEYCNRPASRRGRIGAVSQSIGRSDSPLPEPPDMSDDEDDLFLGNSRSSAPAVLRCVNLPGQWPTATNSTSIYPSLSSVHNLVNKLSHPDDVRVAAIFLESLLKSREIVTKQLPDASPIPVSVSQSRPSEPVVNFNLKDNPASVPSTVQTSEMPPSVDDEINTYSEVVSASKDGSETQGIPQPDLDQPKQSNSQLFPSGGGGNNNSSSDVTPTVSPMSSHSPPPGVE